MSSSVTSSSVTGDRSLRDIYNLVHSHRWLLTVFVVSAMSSSLLLTYVFSQKFQAGTIVMYRPTDAVQSAVAIPDKTALGFPVPTLPFEAVGDTIERIGKSERVLRQVVVDLGLDLPEQNNKEGLSWYYTEVKSTTKRWLTKTWQVLKFGHTVEEDPTTNAIIGLTKYVSINTQKNYTSTISMIDKYPERAAVIVDRIAAALVEEVKELSLFAVREQSERLTERLAEKEIEIATVQSKIEQLKEDWDFDVLQNEIAMRLETAEKFEAELLQNEIKLSTSRATMDSLSKQRAELETVVPTSQTVQDDPIYGELQALEAQYRVEADSLLVNLGANHRDVQAVVKRINSIDEKMQDFDATRIASEVSGTNPTYEQLRLEEITAIAKVEGLAAENTSLTKVTRLAKDRVISPRVVSQLEMLELSLGTLKEDYTHIATALEKAKTAEVTSVPEIRVLFNATPIHEPVRPIKIYHVALSGVLAISLGFAVVFVFDFGKSLWNVPLTMMSSSPESRS